jgi:hypothetical protein
MSKAMSQCEDTIAASNLSMCNGLAGSNGEIFGGKELRHTIQAVVRVLSQFLFKAI